MDPAAGEIRIAGRTVATPSRSVPPELDTHLRAALQEELFAQRRVLGAAAVYATHDVVESLAVADRVALLGSGRIVQVGSPRAVYEEPIDLWAARLTGPASVLEARVTGLDVGRVRLRPDRPGSPDLEIEAAGGATPGVDPPADGRALVRPDWVRLGGPLPASVAGVWYRGSHTDYALETPVGRVLARQPGPPAAAPGADVSWELERVWVVPDPGGPATVVPSPGR